MSLFYFPWEGVRINQDRPSLQVTCPMHLPWETLWFQFIGMFGLCQRQLGRQGYLSCCISSSRFSWLQFGLKERWLPSSSRTAQREEHERTCNMQMGMQTRLQQYALPCIMTVFTPLVHPLIFLSCVLIVPFRCETSAHQLVDMLKHRGEWPLPV